MRKNSLSDLIGSRICHDLISPLGAIGNGVELLSMSGIGEVPEMALISDSVDSANARIRYFRIAYGAASADARLGSGEVHSVMTDIYKGSRIRLDWRIDQDLPRAEVKLAFLLLSCLESALPWGGSITVVRNRSADWSLTAEGRRLKVDQELWDMISNPHSETQVTASEVQFALVQPTAARFGRKVTVVSSERSITVSF